MKTVNANPKERYLWDLSYVDAPAMIEMDTNTDGTRDYRLWATWDLSHNISSLVTDQGKVVEHYIDTPYGQRPILNGASNYAGTGADADGTEYTVDTNGSDYGILLGFQGKRLDQESGDWNFNARENSPVANFLQRDPLGSTAYLTEAMNLTEFVKDQPITFQDPSGKAVTCTECRSIFNVRAARIQQVFIDQCKTLGIEAAGPDLIKTALGAGAVQYAFARYYGGPVVFALLAAASSIATVSDYSNAVGQLQASMSSANAALLACLSTCCKLKKNGGLPTE